MVQSKSMVEAQDELVELKVFIEARGPLLLGSGLTLGNINMSKEYIPGSVWRGGFAKMVLNGLGVRGPGGQSVHNERISDEFHNLFNGDNPAHFGFLYPVNASANQAVDWEALPLPLTAQQCKLHGGFPGEEGGHGAFDWASRKVYEKAGGEGKRLKVCPICSGRLDRMKGFVSNQPVPSEQLYQRQQVNRRSLVRVGLNRLTETAQDSMLYVQDVVVPKVDKGKEKPLTFVGSWRGTRQQRDELVQMRNDYLLPSDKGYELRIGTARARGMGNVRLRLAPSKKSPSYRKEALEGRLKSFQPVGRRGEPLDPEHLYAILDMRSPLLMWDEYGQLASPITTEVLRAYYPEDSSTPLPKGLELLTDLGVLSVEQWSGWSGVWRLPKPVMPAIGAGSVLFLRVPQAERNPFIRFLTLLEVQGMGERRAEGWGELSVCDPFHLVHDELKYLK